MCTGRRQEGGESCNHNHNNSSNLYPRLSELFQQFMGDSGQAGGRREDHAGDGGMSREQAGDLIRDILGNMVYGDQRFGGDHRPSAPPATEGATAAPSGGGWQRPNNGNGRGGEWFNRTFRANQCPTCHQHSNLPTAIISSFGRNVFTALTVLIPILIMPRIFLAIGVYVFALKSLGWPVKTFLAAAFAFFALMQLDSTLITIVALAAVFKTCVLGRPLLNREHWNARLGI